MSISLNNAIVYTDSATFYDICEICNENGRMTLYDSSNLIIGFIEYESTSNEIGFINRNDEGELLDFETTLFKDGKPTKVWKRSFYGNENE